jgi:signal transduction histidine kinase
VLERYARATPGLDTLLATHGHVLETRDRQRARELLAELPSVAADILETAELSARVVRQIGRVLRGSASDEESSVDPLGIVHHALSICRSELPAGAVARYGGPPTVPLVKMVPSDLFRVMVNLVLNAAQALKRKPNGPHTVEIDLRYDRDRVDIIVRDDGPGMSQSVLHRAPKEFFTTRSDGTGLGLSQCAALVDRARGTLTIDSVEGEGTTVTVSLVRHEILAEPPAALDAG